MTYQQEKDAILAKLKSGEMEMAKASQALTDLESKRKTGLYCEVGPAGGVSVYGLQSSPVTLYATPKEDGKQGQWQRLADFMPEVLEFISANTARIEAQLAHAKTCKDKGEKPTLVQWPPPGAKPAVTAPAAAKPKRERKKKEPAAPATVTVPPTLMGVEVKKAA